MTNAMQERVAASAKLLDTEVPNWHELIDVPSLDMNNPQRCICGQLQQKANYEGNALNKSRAFQKYIDESSVELCGYWIQEIKERLNMSGHDIQWAVKQMSEGKKVCRSSWVDKGYYTTQLDKFSVDEILATDWQEWMRPKTQIKDFAIGEEFICQGVLCKRIFTNQQHYLIGEATKLEIVLLVDQNRVWFTFPEMQATPK